MPTINDMVKEHNALAKRTGDPALNSWKQDKEKLQARIDKLKASTGGTFTGRISATKPTATQQAKPASKMVFKKKLPIVKTPSKELQKADELLKKEVDRVTDDTITVVDVAEELNIDPKVARAKLRRKGLKANEGRWPRFKRDSAEHKDMIKLLKGDSNANK